ncbi:MAG TPA: anaerobic ribonucleoside-triphosphate reductase activating protein [Candidatus Onthovicinus excrementipullorum]|nr:anaerobic ribonucleoside-triphosphate reductase activating protein [Candidatus Onthovicinus excrementipullorum]
MGEKLRLAGVIRESVVDGPGWRFVVFVQGCPHHCEGCQNPQTHDFKGGYEGDCDRLFAEFLKNPILAGMTMSGGEPFSQARPLAALAHKVHEAGKNVVTFTGWTYEQLIAGATEQNGWMDLLQETDYLIDGKFELAKKSLEIKFRGSTNQRIIDPQLSLAAGHAVEVDL